jgi:hypothetical protein
VRFYLLVVVLQVAAVVSAKGEPIAIGSRLELFVDDFLIEQLNGDARQHVHQPEPKEVVLVTDRPWEGNTCAYYTIFRDGELYRMYYRGSHADETTQRSQHREVTCYAESRDGVRWTRPDLGLFEWEGSKANNIILDGIGTHCFVAFCDGNPDCLPAARYKGISRGRPVGKRGLYVFQSPDAIHWKLLKDEPVITKGAFDSQNLAFWDPLSERYVEYHRTFSKGVRSIMTSTSNDFIHWTKPVLLRYVGAPKQHMYTNAIRPYPRAPHIYIGFPTRYLPKTSQVEPVFMSSRDGMTFRRFEKPVIPRTAPEDRNGNRSNYMANALVSLPNNDRQLAVYGTEAYYSGTDSRLRRFLYRVDGFVSVRCGVEGGELITKTLTFNGQSLVLNFATHNDGRVAVELQDAGGKPIRRFELDACTPLSGDAIAQPVGWRSGPQLETLAGKPVRLRFLIRNADLFSFRFCD